MRLVNLKIERKDTYYNDVPKVLVGTVQMAGESGKIEVTLSPKTIGDIISLIKSDVVETATTNAKQCEQAITNASNENLLIEG